MDKLKESEECVNKILAKEKEFLWLLMKTDTIAELATLLLSKKKLLNKVKRKESDVYFILINNG